MSENLNRSTPDFSMYDSMSIGELEEILRADALGPERADSDVDEILYVMEVLAKKRRENGTAGKTALEAYQEFQQHYLPKAEEKSKSRHKSIIIPFRRIAAVAACLVLVSSLSITANAFSFKDVWNAVVTWAQETFSFSMGVEISEPKADSELEYESLQAALTDNERYYNHIPTKIPDDYKLENIIVDINPIQEVYIAVYSNGNSRLKITVKTYIEKRPEQVEMSEDFKEIYSYSGIDYYIFSNIEQNRAVWIADSYECNISGTLTVKQLKGMIESIGKG